jgi:hypothetical protein
MTVVERFLPGHLPGHPFVAWRFGAGRFGLLTLARNVDPLVTVRQYVPKARDNSERSD